jgi:ribonuclease Z
VTVDGKLINPEDVLYKVAGKRVAFIPDTQWTQDLLLLAKFADILICESSFTAEHEEKAREFRHMTAEHAARVAQAAEAQRLILTHFSQRYVHTGTHLEEAKAIFPNTEAAFDLMKITL